jgi:hypothetical protein
MRIQVSNFGKDMPKTRKAPHVWNFGNFRPHEASVIEFWNPEKKILISSLQNFGKEGGKGHIVFDFHFGKGAQKDIVSAIVALPKVIGSGVMETRRCREEKVYIPCRRLACAV